MTVGEYFEQEKISLDILSEKAEESDYWVSAEKFIEDKWVEDLETLTPKQLNWATKILEDLVEQRIEGRL